MAGLRTIPGGTAEGRDRLWRLLNIVLVAGSVAATALAVGIVIALFLWLYTLPPVESERVAPRVPVPRQAAPPPPPPQAPDPEAAPPPPPPPAAPAPAVPKAAAPAAPAPPAEAEPAPVEGGRRSRRAVRRGAQPPNGGAAAE